jgi:integrase/recombinase XerC
MSKKVLIDAVNDYLSSVKGSRSVNTAKTYANALQNFLQTLVEHGIDPTESMAANLAVDSVGWFASSLKDYSPATERLYLTAVTGFFEYLAAENLADVNLPRIHLLIRQRARKPGQRLPQFPKDAIDEIINNMINRMINPDLEKSERLRQFRDKAFILCLADTGLRVHEACGLRRGDIDWFEGHAMVIGKGDRQAMVRFSQRSLKALKEYLGLRSELDGASGRALTSLPVFARHDQGAGKKIKPITTTTGRNIVNETVAAILGREAVGTITPHSFRHFFVTRVLQSSGNLKLAQELARHQNISVTQRYAHLSDHELDQGYYEVFENKE